MGKKSTFNKSICLKNNPDIVNWIKAQRNLSRSITVLILNSIHQHNNKFVDVFDEYEDAINQLAFQSVLSPDSAQAIAKGNDANSTNESPLVNSPDVRETNTSRIGFTTQNTTPNILHPSNPLDRDEIPAEYL